MRTNDIGKPRIDQGTALNSEMPESLSDLVARDVCLRAASVAHELPMAGLSVNSPETHLVGSHDLLGEIGAQRPVGQFIRRQSALHDKTFPTDSEQAIDDVSRLPLMDSGGAVRKEDGRAKYAGR